MLKAVSAGVGATDVTSAAVLTANQLVVGDDGARGIKTANATITGPYTFSGAITLAAGTLTASAPGITSTQTWNNAGVNFVANLTNVTFTAAATFSFLEKWQVGGSDRINFSVSNASSNANIVVLSGTSGRISTHSAGSSGWQEVGATGPKVYIEASANILSLSSNTPQVWTNTTNAESGTADTGLSRISAGVVGVGTGAAGSAAGTATAIAIFGAATTSSWGINYFNPGLQMGSACVVGWGTNSSASDAGLSRIAAGVIGVGTGAAGSVAGGAEATYFRTIGSTVAALPAAGAGLVGQRRHVTDANATTFATTVAGGGANVVPVFCDGTNWIIG